MSDYITNDTELQSVANAIRTKGGTSAPLVYPTGFVNAISAIEVGVDTSDANATTNDMLSGKTAYVDGQKIIGNIPSKSSSNLTASGATVTAPAGYYSTDATKTIDSGSTTQNAPTIDSSTGLVTATATVTAGYQAADTKSNTLQLTIQAAQTITPGTTNQTIAAGKYLTGAQTIAGDSNLVAANIAEGVNIFGVTGTHSGGGGGGASANAVNFRDYDGTIVQSYSAADFAALTAMPENPSHDGLTAQGWNWTLAKAQAYVAKYGRLEIGQMYITDDGKTRVYIHLEQGRTSPMLGCCPNGTVDVDWGDGTAHDTLTGTSTSAVQWTPNHAYAAPGNYVIKLTVTGSMGVYGNSSNNQFSGLLRYASNADGRNHVYQNAIQRVELGSSVTNIGSSAFQNCYSLANITIPDGVTSIGSNAFQNCSSLVSVTIPDGVTSISSYVFRYCYGLANVTIPDGVTSISSNAFDSCYSVAEYHLAPITPPTLSSATAFAGIPADCIIYVPYSADHSILEAYKTAANWSTYASYMQEEAA